MQTGFWSVAAAGAATFASWLGWGWTCTTFLQIGVWRRAKAWGIHAAIGMGVTLFLIAALLAFHQMSVVTMNVITGAGIILLLCELVAHRNDLRNFFLCTPRQRDAPYWWIGLLILLSGYYATSVLSPALNNSDDAQAYTVFPKQMLQSGTFEAPFVTRRIQAYGGHQALQAQVLAASWLIGKQPAMEYNLFHEHVVDEGLSVAALFALLSWIASRSGRRSGKQATIATMVVAGMFLLVMPRVNTNSEMSGTVLFIALGVAMKEMLRRIPRRNSGTLFRISLLTGILATAAISLRAHFVVAVGALSGIWWCFAILDPEKGFRNASSPLAAVETLAAGRTRKMMRVTAAYVLMLGTMAITVAPWAWMMWKSNDTPLYPLFPGDQHGAWLDVGEHITILTRINRALVTLLYPPLLMAAIPVVFCVWLRRWRTVFAVYAASLLAITLMAGMYRGIEPSWIFRYSLPLLAAGAFLSFCCCVREWSSLRRPVRWGMVVVLIAFVCVQAYGYSEAYRRTNASWMVFYGLGAIVLGRLGGRLSPWIIGLAGIAVAWIGTWKSHAILPDNGALFFQATSIGLLTWGSFLSRIPVLRWILRGGALIVCAVSLWWLTNTMGELIMISSCVMIALAIMLLGAIWRIWTSNIDEPPISGRSLGQFRAAAFVAGGLLITIMAWQWGFVFDNFYAWLLFVGIATAALLVNAERLILLKVLLGLSLITLVATGIPQIYYVGYYPFSLAFLLCVLVFVAIVGPHRDRVLRWIAFPGIVVGTIFLVAAVAMNPHRISPFEPSHRTTAQNEAEARIYREAQAIVPPGETFLAIVSNPVWLDYQRNRIWSVDVSMQLLSPGPGLRGDSPAAMLTYLRSIGIEYALVESRRKIIDGEGQGSAVGRDAPLVQQCGETVYRSDFINVIRIPPVDAPR